MITRTLRKGELKKLVPLSDSTIYAMEQRGEFPKRFALSPRCVVWDFDEVQTWLTAQKKKEYEPTHKPDMSKRKYRPVRGAA